MRQIRLIYSIAILATILVFSACKKDDNDSNKLDVVTTMVDATSYTDWVYFSLSENRVVEVANPETETTWDIALMRNHFKTNSGTSGNGNGGAFDAGAVNFDTYVLAPETGYVVDSTIQHFNLPIMTYETVNANTVLETWGTFVGEMPPVMIPNNKVFVVKTAEGHYAKIMVLNYYGTVDSGHITFKFVYQPNGTTTLE